VLNGFRFDVGANLVALGGMGKRGQARVYRGVNDFRAQNVILGLVSD
jgi:hypothetical protein